MGEIIGPQVVLPDRGGNARTRRVVDDRRPFADHGVAFAVLPVKAGDPPSPHFSPYDLRHRRVSLLHLGGMPWARIGELVGHDDLVTTARTYTHLVADERELDYVKMVTP